MAQSVAVKSAGASAANTLLPWVLIGAGVYALIRILENIGPSAGKAVGGAVGGAFGGAAGGFLGGAGKAFAEGLGIMPTQGTAIPTEAGAVVPIPAGSGPSAPTASINKPADGGSATRAFFSGTYTVEVAIRASEEITALVEFETDEIPRLFSGRTKSKKVQAVKLKPGVNLLAWDMPYAVDLLKTLGAGADVIGVLYIDGRAVARSTFLLE